MYGTEILDGAHAIRLAGVLLSFPPEVRVAIAGLRIGTT